MEEEEEVGEKEGGWRDGVQENARGAVEPFRTVTLITKHLHIISRAVVRQFSADGDSHRMKHLRHTAV